MKNSILFLGLLLLSNSGISQRVVSVDTLHFSADSSYSRIVVRYKKHQLLFGTSKTGVIAFCEKDKNKTVIIPPVNDGEFRDIVVNKDTIFAIVSGDIGMVYKGNLESATPIFNEKGIFLDDISLFKNEVIILGDPVDGTFFFRKRTPESNTFLELDQKVKSDYLEGCYAASGTCAQYLNPDTYFFVSGGDTSARFHYMDLWSKRTVSVDLPMKTGEGAGPFSLFFWDPIHGVIVGGDYRKNTEASKNACYTTDGGKTWIASEIFPNGYRSCVTGNKKLLFSCGTTGIDYSKDGGITWHFLMKGNFCALLLEKKTLYATTNKGYCLKLKLKF
ncbi:sialidase family protein [Fluviicola chungangensis]|uniref:Exo-alpha-sialidase n=1 Tax=Fluviicola chungangensis TaxID=2597671 RepID=A0A556N615_9FLAO|nr:sialidase family protein [Fluviicola chungangensis]TSJ47632.1 exo-alpha-sialidase [Fluviicola chungangensis]